ncbi:MAG TPA: hypothetical protein PKA33_12380 [Amaricoccus sp.]|uniref:hypothetical protein n=1 Tax=Amaricoccus sp. TaxID=1872485 RepID=UPI002B89DFE0|nr:hypothetical protein [Amaricoccus sp.]HMQ95148.1 hypothetical protein [Amaricoccus sp.]HMR53216.1 hypothetical protein [Amaricoccus sp.]HMU00149.1 hypothetical protein [Amaricoccus sp.]
MKFGELDETKLLFLMGCGAVFALAGLWLMFRPKGRGSAKLELFGLKFESSSAGLLVFLIGAGFIATPLVVAERQSSAGPDNGGRGEIPGTPVDLEHAGEKEPNNSPPRASEISLGVVYSARLDAGRGDREDWYAIPVSALGLQDLSIEVSSGAATFDEPEVCEIAVLDAKAEPLETWRFAPIGSSLRESVFVGEHDYIFLKASTWGTRMCEYDIRITGDSRL